MTFHYEHSPLTRRRWATRFIFSLTAGWDWTAETLTNYSAFWFFVPPLPLFWMEGEELWTSWSSRLVIGCSCWSQTVCIHRDAAWLFPDILCDSAQIREQRRLHHILRRSRLGTARGGSAKTLENPKYVDGGFFVCLRFLSDRCYILDSDTFVLMYFAIFPCS